MSNLLHRRLSQMSAILFYGGHLENGGISRGQGSEFDVCHVKNIWRKSHACIIN